MTLPSGPVQSPNRREFLAIGAAAATAWTSDPWQLIRSNKLAISANAPRNAEETHLDIAVARALLAQLLQEPDWLNRHLDLQSYRSASLEAIQYLAQVSLPMWTVNFEALDAELLNAILTADTANLRFGPQSDLEAWAALDVDALSSVMAFALEFDRPQAMSVATAGRIRRCNCEALRFGEFDGIDPELIEELARFEGTLIFDVLKAEDPRIAAALTTHDGEGVYIYSDVRPALDVIHTFRQTRRRSLCLEERPNESGWLLAWEPTRAFVQRQHSRFVGGQSGTTDL